MTFATRIASVIAVGLLVSSCASGWGCSGWEKISASHQDTSGTKKQVLEHNEFGRKQGCWR